MNPILGLPLALGLSVLSAPIPPATPTARADDRAADHDNLEDGLALQGYDPVAYFPEGGGEPREGRDDIALDFDGVTYRFASRDNLRRFASNPRRFEPEYGGWCAYAMSQGDKVEVDAESFLIDSDGRLFVFYDGFLADTRKKWLKDPSRLELLADGQWARLSGQSIDAAPEPVATDVGGVAMGGFDPVSYLGDNPESGETSIEVQLDGAVYRFVDEANRARFLSEPEALRPRFGGWGAESLVRGKRMVADPTQYLILDGRLTLFATTEGRATWEANPDGRLKEARTAWSEDS